MVRIGLDQATWNAVKGEIRLVLITRARLRGLIPYSEVTSQLESAAIDPHSQIFAHLLGEISEEEDQAGRGMLSVIVVHKEGDMRPGPGFFELAQGLGRKVADLDKTWLQELDCVHRYWSVEAPRATSG